MNKNVRVFMRLGFLSAICLPMFAGSVVTVTPEPAAIGLIGVGFAAVAGIRYYRSRKR